MKSLSLTSVASVALALTACAVDGSQVSVDETDTGEDAVEESTQYDELASRCDDRNQLPNNTPVRNPFGVSTTVSAHGSIDLDNEFFQDLGGNGRRCVSCHVPSEGWTITPKQLQKTFAQTDGGKFEDGLGLSAVFRTVDGSNSPKADVSTVSKRRKAYSMLLDKGLIRIGLPVPANAEFELIAVDDPYKFASAKELSLFRRPLPTTNLKFDSTVMWDGREMVAGQTIQQIFETQSSNAVVAHAEAKPISIAQRKSIVSFMTALASAQVVDKKAGDLHDDGAKGGPAEILKQEFHIGINDNFGDSVTHAPFTPVVFTIFDKWAKGDGWNNRGGYGHGGHHDDEEEARRAIARGQAIFNTKAITISGVSGINDEAIFGTPKKLVGTCTTCHNTPNGGNHSVVAPLNIGLVDASRRTADMPLYTFRNKTTGQTVKVTDPGRAMISGKWAHIGRFKGPMLRNLAPRAPYFHNGFAKDLDAVVDFYEERFAINFTKQEKSDLVAFLRAL